MPVETAIDDLTLAPIERFQTLGEVQEHTLVVLAMNLDCLVTVDEEGSYLLHADPAFALAIREEFRLYAAEQQELQDPPHIPIFASGLELALLWVCSLLFFFMMQDKEPSFTANYLNSSVDVIQHHEFYRPFTALFLHGDIEHLMGNVAFGLIFCILVANSLGPFTAWGLILSAGFLGNTANAIWQYPGPFFSLGASTATFGALGLLVGVGIHVAWISRRYRESFRVVLPLAAGLIMVSNFGMGGPSVDVSGHLWGFVFGVALGVPAAIVRTRNARNPKELKTSM